MLSNLFTAVLFIAGAITFVVGASVLSLQGAWAGTLAGYLRTVGENGRFTEMPPILPSLLSFIGFPILEIPALVHLMPLIMGIILLV
jgi:hypothetical protein